MAEFFTYRANVERVIDGDTAVMVIDLGFKTFATHSIRFADINAPELFSGPPEERALGLASKLFLEHWVATTEQRSSGGSHEKFPFVIRTGKGESFGRWVAHIWAARDLDGYHEFDETSFGLSINAHLVSAGHAVYSHR